MPGAELAKTRGVPQFCDESQVQVERMYISNMTPSRIAADLDIPVAEIRKRIDQIEADYAQELNRRGESWAKSQVFFILERSRARNLKYDNLMDAEMMDPLKCLAGKRAEDQFQYHLVSRLQAGAAAGRAKQTGAASSDITAVLEALADARKTGQDVDLTLTEADMISLDRATFSDNNNIESFIMGDDPEEDEFVEDEE